MQPYRPPTIMGPSFPPPPRPTVMQSVKEGVALGAGASIARNVVDRMLGSGTPPKTQFYSSKEEKKQTICKEFWDNYQTCNGKNFGYYCKEEFLVFQTCMDQTK